MTARASPPPAETSIVLARKNSGEAQATRTNQPPVIDGDLSDPVWSQAIPFDDFTQQIPDEGKPPSQRTEVRILYDHRAIYFGIRCFDSDPATIVANLTRRDRDTFSDTIWLDIDTRGDHRSAFHFEVNAAGVQRDGIRTGDRPDLGAIDWQWDALWESAVQRDSKGWTAEIAIPLSELRYESGGPVTWRMEIRRFNGRRSEMDQWIFIPLLEFSEMFKYGPMVGLNELPSLHRFRLTPFVVERVRNRRSPPELLLARGIDSTTRVGLDVSYGVTSNLALQATLLRDFGQVEADEGAAESAPFYPTCHPSDGSMPERHAGYLCLAIMGCAPSNRRRAPRRGACEFRRGRSRWRPKVATKTVDLVSRHRLNERQ